jgi:membrane AbrB-like protein
VGASITPALLGRLPEMAWSVALIPVFVLLAAGLGYPFFRRVRGLDHPTAWYAAAPGGLSDMLVFGQQAGGDVRALSLIHATRVLAIVSAAPFLMGQFYDADLAAPPGVPTSALPLVEGALMVAAAAVGWALAARARLFGAVIIGPMIAAAALSLSGLIGNRPPAEAIWAAQFFIGLNVGVRYSGVTVAELRRDVAAGLGYVAILAAATVAFAEAVALAGLAPPLEAFLAFAPGGQAEMAVLAIVAGADVAFVVTHHLLRLVLVITLAPVAARLYARWREV